MHPTFNNEKRYLCKTCLCAILLLHPCFSCLFSYGPFLFLSSFVTSFLSFLFLFYSFLSHIFFIIIFSMSSFLPHLSFYVFLPAVGVAVTVHRSTALHVPDPSVSLSPCEPATGAMGRCVMKYKPQRTETLYL
jgi:hypothetical protein